MKKIKNPLKAKIVVRPSHPALKIAVIVLILFSMAALLALWWVNSAIGEQTEKLRAEAAAIEYANSELKDKVENPDSIDNVRDIAKEELGLVDPKTVVIDPN